MANVRLLAPRPCSCLSLKGGRGLPVAVCCTFFFCVSACALAVLTSEFRRLPFIASLPKRETQFAEGFFFRCFICVSLKLILSSYHRCWICIIARTTRKEHEFRWWRRLDTFCWLSLCDI